MKNEIAQLRIDMFTDETFVARHNLAIAWQEAKSKTGSISTP
jgi:hypothetical protein